MYEQIEKSLSNYIKLDKIEFEYFVSKLQLKHLHRKELLLNEGQICKNAFFINDGCLRIYHNIDGLEITGLGLSLKV
jgi:CRP-like cAMP-binding protein